MLVDRLSRDTYDMLAGLGAVTAIVGGGYVALILATAWGVI
ncbi:hypothetical protein AB7C87_23535 [Natrarchaeobius sp. A-rgal3]